MNATPLNDRLVNAYRILNSIPSADPDHDDICQTAILRLHANPRFIAGDLPNEVGYVRNAYRLARSDFWKRRSSEKLLLKEDLEIEWHDNFVQHLEVEDALEEIVRRGVPRFFAKLLTRFVQRSDVSEKVLALELAQWSPRLLEFIAAYYNERGTVPACRLLKLSHHQGRALYEEYIQLLKRLEMLVCEDSIDDDDINSSVSGGAASTNRHERSVSSNCLGKSRLTGRVVQRTIFASIATVCVSLAVLCGWFAASVSQSLNLVVGLTGHLAGIGIPSLVVSLGLAITAMAIFRTSTSNQVPYTYNVTGLVVAVIVGFASWLAGAGFPVAVLVSGVILQTYTVMVPLFTDRARTYTVTSWTYDVVGHLILFVMSAVLVLGAATDPVALPVIVALGLAITAMAIFRTPTSIQVPYTYNVTGLVVAVIVGFASWLAGAGFPVAVLVSGVILQTYTVMVPLFTDRARTYTVTSWTYDVVGHLILFVMSAVLVLGAAAGAVALPAVVALGLAMTAIAIFRTSTSNQVPYTYNVTGRVVAVILGFASWLAGAGFPVAVLVSGVILQTYTVMVPLFTDRARTYTVTSWTYDVVGHLILFVMSAILVLGAATGLMLVPVVIGLAVAVSVFRVAISVIAALNVRMTGHIDHGKTTTKLYQIDRFAIEALGRIRFVYSWFTLQLYRLLFRVVGAIWGTEVLELLLLAKLSVGRKKSENAGSQVELRRSAEHLEYIYEGGEYESSIPKSSRWIVLRSELRRRGRAASSAEAS